MSDRAQNVTIETQSQLVVDGVALFSAPFVSALRVSARVDIIDVRQVGATITGKVRITVDLDIVDITFEKAFSIPTGLANPYEVSLGTVSIPLVGEVAVIGRFSYDLPRRQVCGELTLAGLIRIAKKCVNF